MAYNPNSSAEDNAYEDEYVSQGGEGGMKINCVLVLSSLSAVHLPYRAKKKTIANDIVVCFCQTP